MFFYVFMSYGISTLMAISMVSNGETETMGRGGHEISSGRHQFRSMQTEAVLK